MEIASERTSMAQEGLPSSHNVIPFTPTHPLRDGFLSFTEFLLRNVEEWSKPHTPLPLPPPPITFSGSDRFIKGRLPHRTLAISASLSSLFDDATKTRLDVRNNGDVHADKGTKMAHEGSVSEVHGNGDGASAVSTECNISVHTDNAQRFDDVATCGTYNLLPDDCQHASGSDDATIQLVGEDDGRAPLPSEDEVPDGVDCRTKELEGSVYVSDSSFPDKISLHLKNDGGDGKITTKISMDAVGGHSLALGQKSSLPSTLSRLDADGVAEPSLPSLSQSPNDTYLAGHMGVAPQLSLPCRTKSPNANTLMSDADRLVEFSSASSTKCFDDNNLTGACPSLLEHFNENSLKDDISAVPELSLLSKTGRHDDKLTGNIDGVTELSSPSIIDSSENSMRAAEGLSWLPSPWKSSNANSLTGHAEGVAEIQLLPSTATTHDGNVLQEGVMEAPIVLQQDEQLQDIEEGELSERISDEECVKMSSGGLVFQEGENCPLNDTMVESKAIESSTDDEMNQPISLFISRYRTRSSVNPSTRKTPSPLNADKTKGKRGTKRKLEEQEQVHKEVTSSDMAVKVQSKKKARGVEKARAGRSNQVMETPAVVLCEKEEGASCTLSKGLTQHGLAGSEHSFAPESAKVCPPIAAEEGLSMVDTGNDHDLSQAEVTVKKPRGKLTAERKKKKQQKKHRKAYERRVGKIRLKPCIEKPKEKKTCHFYARGKCGKGASCTFSHAITPITKSEVCKYFIKNCCLRGDDCPYSHALSTFPCKYFHTRGRCAEADSCRFSHEPISEEAKQKLLAKIEQEQQVREEASKVTDMDSFGRTNPKHAVLPSDLELFALGGKCANKTPLKVAGAATSKISCLNTQSHISKIRMLVAAKKAASAFIGGVTSVNTTNLERNKSLFCGSLLDTTEPLADKSSENDTTCTTKSMTRVNELPSAQAAGFSSNCIMTRERKTKVDAFLQAQLDNNLLMRKPKLGTGLESPGGCYTLLNQPRVLSMGQASPLKAPNMSASGDPNAKAAMGFPHASADYTQLMPSSEPTMCTGTKHKLDFSTDLGKSTLNEESAGINASVPSRSVLGPSLLDLVSTPQRVTFPKGPSASTPGLLPAATNATPKRSAASVFLDRFLKG